MPFPISEAINLAAWQAISNSNTRDNATILQSNVARSVCSYYSLRPKHISRRRQSREHNITQQIRQKTGRAGCQHALPVPRPYSLMAKSSSSAYERHGDNARGASGSQGVHPRGQTRVCVHMEESIKLDRLGKDNAPLPFSLGHEARSYRNMLMPRE